MISEETEETITIRVFKSLLTHYEEALEKNERQ